MLNITMKWFMGQIVSLFRAQDHFIFLLLIYFSQFQLHSTGQLSPQKPRIFCLRQLICVRTANQTNVLLAIVIISLCDRTDVRFVCQFDVGSPLDKDSTQKMCVLCCVYSICGLAFGIVNGKTAKSFFFQWTLIKLKNECERWTPTRMYVGIGELKPLPNSLALEVQPNIGSFHWNGCHHKQIDFCRFVERIKNQFYGLGVSPCSINAFNFVIVLFGHNVAYDACLFTWPFFRFSVTYSFCGRKNDLWSFIGKSLR